MRCRDFRAGVLLLGFASALSSSDARAVNGLIEINQASATAGGITPGDAPGFPVTISVPGSYRLTSNLTVSDPNLDGIDLNANGITLDLNGFAITGPVSCGSPGTIASCAPAGSGVGVRGFEPRVRNGTVRGFAGGGVQVTVGAQIDDLLVTSNGGSGIFVVSGFGFGVLRVENARAIRNGGLGIDAGVDSVVQRCVAEWNGSGGISASFGSLVIESVASQNGGAGISASSGSVIQDNVAANNKGPGILTGQAGLVTGNSAFQNHQADGIDAGLGVLVSDNSSSYNDASGIAANAGSSVQGTNTIINGIDGLYLVPSAGNPAAYRENVMDANANSGVGFPVANGVNMGANYCNGSSCP